MLFRFQSFLLVAFLLVPATIIVAAEPTRAKSPQVGQPEAALPVKPAAPKAKPKQPPAEPVTHLLSDFRRGPMAGVDEIVFAVRQPGKDGHWYANFGYYAEDEKRLTYGDGGRLVKLNLVSGKTITLVDDPRGAVRDPVVSYDAKRILFSYRKDGSPYYHLYEIGADGSGLRQLTDGEYDDIEPCYLPDGEIVFVSSRCKRWVNCWLTHVAVLHRCDADGRHIRELSSNNEHDNTPWILPNGQILYTRWEYVDRNQVSFHHLWVTTPDGARQTVFYGNMRAGTTMIDAKPIPKSEKIVVSFSPGHGHKEHDGTVTVLDPRLGPDEPRAARAITKTPTFRDPWAFSEDAFMAAEGRKVVLINAAGQTQTLYEVSAEDRGLQCHEPRPLVARPKERDVIESVDWSKDTGRIAVANVYHGRNMGGVKRGDIKRLLVLETLPKPINYTGGMEPLSYGGTFTLERVLGTVPVEEDGSVYAELPALRSVFFVALDEQDMSVKRMQSFMTVMPGETTTCLGCHEPRTSAPSHEHRDLMALRRRPSKLEPVRDVPEVLDFPRDVQPVLDKHCASCHRAEKLEGGVDLTGDRGPMFSLSYFTVTARSLVSDGRNSPGNRPPRAIGSSASRLLNLMDGSHYGAKPADDERKVVRLWIETGAAYPGTYAALGCGSIGGYAQNQLDRSDLQWPSVVAAGDALKRRCAECHDAKRPLPLSPSDEIGGPPWVNLTPTDVRRRYARHLLYNLTRPDKSRLLSAPLAKAAGGYESCGKAIFADTADADYQKILAAVAAAGKRLDEIKRFDMPGFQPRPQYVREMKRFGILPNDLPADAAVDVYAADRQYWQSLWYRAVAPPKP